MVIVAAASVPSNVTQITGNGQYPYFQEEGTAGGGVVYAGLTQEEYQAAEGGESFIAPQSGIPNQPGVANESTNAGPVYASSSPAAANLGPAQASFQMSVGTAPNPQEPSEVVVPNSSQGVQIQGTSFYAVNPSSVLNTPYGWIWNSSSLPSSSSGNSGGSVSLINSGEPSVSLNVPSSSVLSVGGGSFAYDVGPVVANANVFGNVISPVESSLGITPLNSFVNSSNSSLDQTVSGITYSPPSFVTTSTTSSFGGPALDVSRVFTGPSLPYSVGGVVEGGVLSFAAITNPNAEYGGFQNVAGSSLNSLGIYNIPLTNFNTASYPNLFETGEMEAEHLAPSSSSSVLTNAGNSFFVAGNYVSDLVQPPSIAFTNEGGLPIPSVASPITLGTELYAVGAGTLIGGAITGLATLSYGGATIGGTLLANAPVVGPSAVAAGETVESALSTLQPAVNLIQPNLPALNDLGNLAFTVALPVYSGSAQISSYQQQGYPASIASVMPGTDVLGNSLLNSGLISGFGAGSNFVNKGNPIIPYYGGVQFGQFTGPVSSLPTESEQVLAQSGLTLTDLFPPEVVGASVPRGSLNDLEGLDFGAPTSQGGDQPIKAFYSGFYTPGNFGAAQPIYGVSAEGELIKGMPSPAQLPSLPYYSNIVMQYGSLSKDELAALPDNTKVGQGTGGYEPPSAASLAADIQSRGSAASDLQAAFMSKPDYTAAMGFSPDASKVFKDTMSIGKVMANNPLPLQGGLPGTTKSAGIATRSIDESIRNFNSGNPFLQASGYGTYYSSNPYLSAYRSALGVAGDVDVMVSPNPNLPFSNLISKVGGVIAPETFNPSVAARSLGVNVAANVNSIGNTLGSIPEIGGDTQFVKASASSSKLGVEGVLNGEDVKVADIHAEGEGPQIPQQFAGYSLNQPKTSVDTVPTGIEPEQAVRKLASPSQPYLNPDTGMIELQPSSRRVKDIASSLLLQGQQVEELGETTPEALSFQGNAQSFQQYYANRGFPVTPGEQSAVLNVNAFAESSPVVAGDVLPVYAALPEAASLGNAPKINGVNNFYQNYVNQQFDAANKESVESSGGFDSSTEFESNLNDFSSSSSSSFESPSISGSGSFGGSSSSFSSSPINSASLFPSGYSPSGSGSGSGSNSPSNSGSLSGSGSGLGSGSGSGSPSSSFSQSASPIAFPSGGLGPGAPDIPSVFRLPSYSRVSKYVPSVTAFAFNIRGPKPSKLSIESGITVRPILSNSSSRVKIKLMKGGSSSIKLPKSRR